MATTESEDFLEFLKLSAEIFFIFANVKENVAQTQIRRLLFINTNDKQLYDIFPPSNIN